jgi:hypothetical protein
MTLLDEFLAKKGVDLVELVNANVDLAYSGLLDEHENVIGVMATLITLAHSMGQPEDWLGAANLLFLLGYRAGQAAPDLSAFSEALNNDQA